MDILGIVSIVGTVGALGGLVNCAIAGEFVMPQRDAAKGIWRPGWVGNVLIGAVAALVVWAMYGPLASYDLATPDKTKPLTLTLSQLFVSVLIGLGGGNILTQLAQKQADQLTKEKLIATIGKAGESPVPKS
ncbi:MAG: hypothetical protein Q8K07_19925 [Methylicorpusculum sp.]|uniref:hypothetical protein n=1 Tax=Pseudomonadota TaxID=1224 RepID=UPI00271768B7|nr:MULTISPECIES: hypothetical protein [Pseudomonadota]MDO9149984.1 hypothetical protein [Methylotenera sp.]MDP2204291.1 hypothetical protein [Methylicorpusculum sp.]